MYAWTNVYLALGLLALSSSTTALFTSSLATCTPTPTTFTTTNSGNVTTISTSAQPYCPTITSTKSRKCPPPPSNCIEPDCIIEKMTTLPCPAACCPSATATTVVKESCVTTCRQGCQVDTFTVTQSC